MIIIAIILTSMVAPLLNVIVGWKYILLFFGCFIATGLVLAFFCFLRGLVIFIVKEYQNYINEENE
jgi:hypothetical protein